MGAEPMRMVAWRNRQETKQPLFLSKLLCVGFLLVCLSSPRELADNSLDLTPIQTKLVCWEEEETVPVRLKCTGVWPPYST